MNCVLWENQRHSVSVLKLLYDMAGCMSVENSYENRKRTHQINQKKESARRVQTFAPEMLKMLEAGKSKQAVANHFNLNLTTVYKYLREWERIQSQEVEISKY